MDGQKMTYCDYCNSLPLDDVNRLYHDTAYGFPIAEDNELFARLVLEINQAGLSWTTILKKELAFREAYNNFDIETIAHYKQNDKERLLANAQIIRNRLKIEATIYNAQQLLSIQDEKGSFKTWLDEQQCSTLPEWVKVFKKHFKFVGGEIVNEFLMSTGYVEGAHVENCPIYHNVLKYHPKWTEQKKIERA